ncbi:hypothetical protein OEZ86_012559 [Tetradesmus obliquus]|nr:hypothetical protein OEZ86_012559 [Tetradesmus obliquus]
MVETSTAAPAADFVRLEAAGHVDCATLLPVEVASLPRGLHPRCVAFHPLKPLLAVGVASCVGGYDLVSGVRLGRVELRTPAVALTFSRDGSLLVAATQEWHIIGINTSTWRSRVLAPMTEPRSGPLDSIMMAITGGSRPVVFFTRYGKNSIRMAVNSGTGPASAKAKAAEKKLKWGVKLRLDVNKPVVGLAAHPGASQLMVLFDDGSLRSYALTPSGLQMIWPSAFMLPGDAAALGRLSLSQPPCQALPHPFIEGGCLLALGSGSGSLLLLELVGKAEPRVLLKTVMPGNAPVIGLGLQQAERLLLAFSSSAGGALQVAGWQLLDAPVAKSASAQTSALALERVTVYTDDLDAPQATAAAAAQVSSSSSKVPLAGAAAGSGSSSSSSSGVDWQSLWGGSSSSDAALEPPSNGSFLLDKLLAPVVQSAVLHPTLGCIAVQRAPPIALRQAANIMAQRLGQISAPEAAISRRTAAVPLLRLLRSAAPEAGWAGGRVAALHTGLHFWQTAAGMGPARLQFPCHLYFLSPGKLSKYALASKKSGCFLDLPPADKAGRPHSAQQLVHSAKQHAWLVFFESTSSSSSSTRGKGGGSSGSSSSGGGWHFTLVTDAAAAGQASWFLPGRTAYQHAGQGSSAHRFGSAAHGSHGAEAHGHEEAGQLHSGGGVVLWHQAGGRLVMGALPAPGLQYAAGEDSDDPDAAEPATAVVAPDMGQVGGEHSLQLQPNERVVAVRWQELGQGPPLEPYHCAAAILTTQRLLLVSGDLTLLAAVDASCGSVGLTSAITSFLWVGPALLYMTAGGQVMQLTWTGQVQHMASVAASPPPLLAAALTDSLLLLRQNPITGEHEVASRAVGVLQPLVLGWTSLASCGLLPRGLNTARAALQALLEAFDATHVTSGMLWALISGWCGDVAAALAAHAADVEPSVQMAANAAAGRWPAVVSSLRGEHERSVFYPRPAPQGSQLHHKLLAAAAGATMHGQFSAAQQCLEAAGEWETAMALAVCAGDFGALRALVAGVQSSIAMAAGGEREAQDIARLARGLVAAYERSGRAFSLAGSSVSGSMSGGGAKDWRLRAVMADDSFFSNAADWSFGGPGKQPAMETSAFNAPAAFIQAGEVGQLPRADTATLGAYLGNSDLALLEEPGAAAAAAAAGVGVRRASSDHDFLANLDQLVALSAQRPSSATGDKGLARTSTGASSVSSGDGGGAAAAAAAGAASGAGGQARDGLFDFSDDEEGEGSFGWSQRSKFKIHIKSKEEADGANPAAAGSTGASTPELRSAVQKLKLGPPGAGSFKDAFGKGGSSSIKPGAGDSGRSSDESGTAAGIDALYDLSFLAKPSPSSSSGAAAAAAGSSSSSGLPPRGPSAAGGSGSSGSLNSLSTLAGLSSSGTPGLGGPAMRPKPPAPPPPPVISDDDFFAALAPALQAEPPSSSRQQRQAFAAQYLAAVMLLKAAGAGASAKEAKLYRYVCGLKLDDKHSLALVKEAVLRNKHVGNYRYAADQLTVLVTRSLGSAPMEVMARLQEDIDECDSKGGRNASVPGVEQVEEWAGIVGSCSSRQEVEEVVGPLLADSS